MKAKRRTPLGTLQQVVIGLFLAALLIVALESSSTYDEECGWGWPVTVHTSDGHGRHRIRDNHGRCRFEIDLNGRVELAPDFRDVLSVEPGAYLKIRQKRPGERRSIEITAKDGEPNVLYQVDGDKAPFDEAARAWLARVAPRLYRSTGFDAKNRVASLYESGGVEALLQEMDQIDGQHVRGIYLGEGLKLCSGDAGAVRRLLEFARREISSDRALKDALSDSLSTELLEDEGVRDAFLAVLRNIDSDYDLRFLLQELLEERPIDAQRLETLLDAASTLGSDSEATSLLLTVVETLPAGERLPPGFVDVLETIGSDHDQARVLSAALARPGTDAEEGEALLQTATSISADSVQADLLAEVARSWKGPLPPAYYRALETVESDYAQRETAGAVLERHDLDREAAGRLLAAVQGISADFEMSSFLVDFLAVYPEGEELPSDFDDALSTVESSFEHEKVEKALSRRGAPRPAPAAETDAPPADADG